MKLSEYFENKEGFGVLATADNDGKVNAAIYSRPHFIDEDTVAFIATEKLTRANLLSNPSAVYLFKEKDGYKGRRLYLTKIREEQDSPLILQLRRKKLSTHDKNADGHRYLIYFHLDKVLPLVGGEEKG